MSQLLERLKLDLNRQSNPIDRAECAARIACTLARQGRFDEARDSIAALRIEFGSGQSGRVTTWIMLAEGLVLHYEDLSPFALDRIARALVLGQAMKYPEITALAAAWKAHIEFETSRFSAMLRSLSTAYTSVVDEDHDAQTRLAMVLSNSFMITGDREQSQRWFMRGRDHAIKNGDQASIEGLLYNRVAFVLAWFRVAHCMDAVDKAELKRVRFEIASARNLQDLTRISALENHVKLLDARLLILEERYGEAIPALQAVRSAAPFAQHNFDQAFIDLEIEFCLHAMGKSHSTPGVHIGDDMFEQLDIDERIVAAWMQWRLADCGADRSDSKLKQARLGELILQYRTERAQLRIDLSEFELI